VPEFEKGSACLDISRGCYWWYAVYASKIWIL